MNPNKTRNLIVVLFLLFLIFALSYLFFLSNGKVSGLEKHIKDLKFQRDSTNDANIKISQDKQKRNSFVIDSMKGFIQVLQTKDSILIYENRHKKTGNRTLTPAQRNDKLDSLFRANGIR